MTDRLSEYEQYARDVSAARIQHELDIKRVRAEEQSRCANLVADLEHDRTQARILIAGLHLILAVDHGKDRRGNGAKEQVRAVAELLGRLA